MLSNEHIEAVARALAKVYYLSEIIGAGNVDVEIEEYIDNQWFAFCTEAEAAINAYNASKKQTELLNGK